MKETKHIITNKKVLNNIVEAIKSGEYIHYDCCGISFMELCETMKKRNKKKEKE